MYQSLPLSGENLGTRLTKALFEAQQSLYTFCAGQNGFPGKIFARFLHALWWSKPTLQTFQAIPTFRGGENWLYRIAMVTTEYPRFCKPFTRVAVGNTDFQNFYKLPTRLADVKTNPSSFYKPPTGIAVVKTEFPNFYRPVIRFVVVNTDSTRFCKALARFAVVKTDSPNIYNPQ